MRDPERINDFCEKLSEYWHMYPDFRFGQIIENIKSSNGISDIFYVEDNKMMEMIERYFVRH